MKSAWVVSSCLGTSPIYQISNCPRAYTLPGCPFRAPESLELFPRTPEVLSAGTLLLDISHVVYEYAFGQLLRSFRCCTSVSHCAISCSNRLLRCCSRSSVLASLVCRSCIPPIIVSWWIVLDTSLIHCMRSSKHL